MNLNTKDISFVNFNNQVINWLKFNGQKVWEAFKNLIVSGVPPLTLIGSIGNPMVDYKIDGNTKVQPIIPEEYQQVEYIEATGTQYFLLDYIPNNNTNSRGKFQVVNKDVAAVLFGSRERSSSSNFYGFNWSSSVPPVFVNSYYSGVATRYYADTNVHTFSKVAGVLSIDYEAVNTNNPSVATWNAVYNMAVFGCNTGGTVGLNSIARIYSLSIDEGNGDLFNLIPCYRKSDNVIGMYDTVNDYFHINQGAGTFLKGNDAEPTPTPDDRVFVYGVGDKTYNLIDYSDVNKTVNGVTFERKSDGSIVCNGTATADTIVEVGWADLKNGKRYRGTGCPAGGSTSTYRLFFNYLGADLGNGSSASVMTADQKTQVRLFVYTGQVCDNLTFYPMLTEVPDATTKYPYKPAGYEIPVTVGGKNLFDKTNMYTLNRNAYGLQWTYNAEEEAYYASGTQEAALSSYALMKDPTILKDKLKPGHRYILSGNGTPDNSSTRYYVFGNVSRNGKNTYVSSDMDATKFFTWEDGASISIDLRVYSTDGVFREINNAKFQPMLIDVTNMSASEIATLTAQFEEYVEPTTTAIYLDTPLNKLGDYVDDINFGTDKQTSEVSVRTLDGSENWVAHTTAENCVVYRIDNELDPLIGALNSSTYMTNFALTDVYTTASFVPGLYRFSYNQATLTISSDRLYVSSDKTTLSEFKAWLSENKPTIYYPAATPAEKTISLPDISTTAGTNIINVGTTVQPSNMEITYKGR